MAQGDMCLLDYIYMYPLSSLCRVADIRNSLAYRITKFQTARRLSKIVW